MPRPAATADPGMDTPVQALPDPAAEGAPRRGRFRRGGRPPRPPGGLAAALRRGYGHALGSWRPLLAVLLVQLLLALTVVAPFQQRMSARLDRHAHAAALAGDPGEADVALGWQAGLDGGLWGDVKRLEASALEGLSATLVWVVVLAWLFGALAAGGFLGTALDSALPASLGRFFHHGGKNLGRMLRMGFVFLALAWLFARLVFEAWGGSVAASEQSAETGADAFWGARWREIVYVLFFLWLRVAADLGRSDLVSSMRTSAVLAFLRGAGRTIRHPLKTLGLALGVGVPAFVALLGLGVVVRLDGLAGGGWLSLLLLFLVVQLAVLLRWASRAALLAGDLELVGPISRGPSPSHVR